MKTRKLSDLPGIHDWKGYMGVAENGSFGVVPIEGPLIDCDFRRELAAGMTGEMRFSREMSRVYCSSCIRIAEECNCDFWRGSRSVQFLS